MTSNDYPVYDFVAAASVERPLSLALKSWTSKFAEFFQERWKQFSSSEMKVYPTPTKCYTFGEARSKWDQSLGININFDDESQHGLLVSKRQHLLSLVMDILGESSDGDQPARELTAIEVSLCELIYEQVAATLSESWPQQQVLELPLGQLEASPNRCRIFGPDVDVLCNGFQLQLPSGNALIQLVLSKAHARSLFDICDETQSETPAADQRLIEWQNLRSVAVNVCTQLGTAELGLDEVTKLEVGDIVLLDQKIQEPLEMMVNEIPRWRVWPGKTKQQQTVKVESLIS